MALQYSDFQAQTSSEKTVLATIDASVRLMGWVLASGSTYSIACTQTVVIAVEESGVAYTLGSSAGALTAGQYYLDPVAQLLYVNSFAGVNPNGLFVAFTTRFFFANTPITLPYDLASGAEVFWEPMLQSTSQFGVQIDVVNQASEAIEGTGSLTLYNDQSFWPANFDQYIFENKNVSIYSYNRALVASQAQLLFLGYVQKKSYTTAQISFDLKDLLSNLKQPIPLKTIGALAQRTNASLVNAFQRMVFGQVKGHVLVGTDQTLTGYPISGTVSLAVGSAAVVGVGTSFLSQLNPADSLVVGGNSYSIASVANDTGLTLSTAFAGTASLTNVAAAVVAKDPKRWQNRTYFVAAHPLRTPAVQTIAGSSIGKLALTSTADIFAGDTIYVGTYPSGQAATVGSVINANLITLASSLVTIPTIGTTVLRPGVQNLRIDDLLLQYARDYTVTSATPSTVTLLTTAEANACPVQQLTATATFTNNSATVTGSGFKSNLLGSTLVAPVGNASFLEVLSVDSDTSLTLRSLWTGSTVTTQLQFKLKVANEKSIVNCDVSGRTLGGTSSGAFIRTGAGIVQQLLTDVGLGPLLNTASFSVATTDASMDLGFAMPANASATALPLYRNVIADISKSVNGILVQTSSFRLRYGIIQPNKTTATLRLTEPDILSMAVTATAEKMIQTAQVTYQSREYDYLAAGASMQTASSTSQLSTYILKTTISQVFPTFLVSAADALRLAQRWNLLLERSSGLLSITTKLQGATVQVGDVIDLSHVKLFTRFGGTDKRRLVMVQKVQKDGISVQIEGVDLSNAFNRVCTISSAVNQFSSATSDELAYGGYITDTFGMQSNAPSTFGLNIIY